MTRPSNQTIAREAMHKSIKVRAEAKLDLNAPIDVYRLCDTMRVPVRFVPISMEGMYVRAPRTQILISALRPLPRRTFTCGHELGHHVFGHGSTVDELQDEMKAEAKFLPQEFLVQTFAGFLLIPTIGARKAFAVRDWTAATALPTQIFTIACSFGVGYSTLINHLTYGLQMIPSVHARTLLKMTPAQVRRMILGIPSTSPLIVVDQHWSLPTIDTEVDTQLLLPTGTEVEGDGLAWRQDLSAGRLFQATRPGLNRITSPDREAATFVRTSRYQYVGLSQFRHLEESEDDDDE